MLGSGADSYLGNSGAKQEIRTGDFRSAPPVRTVRRGPRRR